MQSRCAALMISGSGRSGTTVVSVLLAQHARAVNLGQARDIWVGWADNVICTCGQALSDCPLWGEIRDTAFGDWQTDDFLKANKQMRAFMDAADGLTDWSDSAALDGLRRDHAAFLDILRRYVIAILDQRQPTLLVDSSKSPEFALAMHLTDLLNVHVLNMVRDPRAVACSWARKKSGSIAGKMRAWRNRQRRLSQWPPAEHLHHRALRYEDFVAHPRETINGILEWVGHPMDPDLFTAPDQAHVSWDNQHLFPPSNEKVLAEKRSEVIVKAPQDWRSRRHWALHLTAMRQTFPDGLRYVLKHGGTPS